MKVFSEEQKNMKEWNSYIQPIPKILQLIKSNQMLVLITKSKIIIRKDQSIIKRILVKVEISNVIRMSR